MYIRKDYRFATMNKVFLLSGHSLSWINHAYVVSEKEVKLHTSLSSYCLMYYLFPIVDPSIYLD